MRGKKAKQIRQLIYGEDYSPRERRYGVTEGGSIRNLGNRRLYLRAKAMYRRGE